MLKVTPAALDQLKKEIKPYVEQGKEWFIRVYMAVG